MKKLIISLLILISCATYPNKLSTEKVTDNANFVLNILEIESKSLNCIKDDSDKTKMICTSIDKEDKTTVLSCNNDECIIIK